MDDKTSIKSEMVESRKCSELESKCLELESEIEKKKTQFEKLEQKFKELEDEKNGIEEELKALKREKKGSEISLGVVDLTREGEGDGVAQLVVENKALESGMKRAENEAESLKKLKELESRVSNEALEGTPSKHIISMEREKEGASSESKPERGRQVRKNLAFEEDRSLGKKMAPSTPGGVRTASSGVIDICDSDDEPDVPHLLSIFGDKNIYISTDHPAEGTVGSDRETTPNESPKRAFFKYSYEENVETCNDSVPVVTPKRKQASNIVTSDTESDEDDVPICKLKRRNIQEIVPNLVSSEMKSCCVTVASPGDDNIENLVTPPRRRLRKGTGKFAGGKRSSSQTHETIGQQGIPATEDVEDDESEDAGSDSESENLNGFIVDDGTEDSDGDDASSGAQDDSDMDFDEILSRLNRTKDQNSEWELEADMLSAFGKDPELCMKAVCALYRQQTSEEKDCKGSLVYNSRGFSKFDAYRGTRLAEFLTDGDPQGELKKSVKELREYDPKGLELCRTFASRYSKQLFDICKNKEDPYFP
ncbi:hypothetical protein CICLE_v10004699mg [Citrus x clementina]|uniref:Uncharacterized protein n=3 Tax=Citrus TaxID=2706 RepID=A0A067ELT8_CITSI|nr:uncharacterized protein LOC18032786 [Citrus x clementina]ESR35357.1 hypothetical protein CICLE_v10004699mg [Citrus x clementina]KAH9677359.1 hypothetical protein KPL71_025350 [Citrus sinensis]KDO56134.1 hypothetical protein CISIN_1g009396mg [Citrus sinensis]